MEKSIYNIFKAHKTVCIDSRKASQNAIFFALKGDNFDGNRYAKAAIENGCSYAIVDDKQYVADERYILVENTLSTLQQLANTHRREMGTTIIGITGTNGKTTTKELINSVLGQKHNTYATQGNLNNHIGVPLTLLQIAPTHQIAIVEMGANHPNEIEELTQIVEPDYGLITNVGKGHLEGFGSLEMVMHTKAALYRYLSQKDKQIFINIGNERLIQMATKSGYSNHTDTITYQLTNKQTTQIAIGKDIIAQPLLTITCQMEEETLNLRTQLVGTYNAENVLAAVTVGKHFGLSTTDIQKGIEAYRPDNHRSQLIISTRNSIIADAYNANPTSTIMAIENFDNISQQDKILILGDMLELGQHTQQEHQHIVNILQAKGYTDVILIGKNYAETKNPYTTFANVSESLSYIQEKSWSNKWILLKGSRGIQLEKTLNYL